MKLLRGYVSKEKLELLLKFTKISSEPAQDALEDHLCKGHPESTAASLNDISQSNFNRALSKINGVASLIEEYNQLSDNKKES